MSVWVYVLFFVAGLFAVNGMPHFISGITGQKHPTPFGNASSALVNVVWGIVNFVVAIITLHYLAINNHHVIREAVIFGAGGVILALLLAHVSSKPPAKRKA